MRTILRPFFMSLVAFAGMAACNPFAPGLDNSVGGPESLLGDQTTVEGVFQNVRYAYTFRDTTIYGQLIGGDFLFSFRDYERGVDATWGRDEEMRVTSGLFQSAQRLDLVWNNILVQSVDSAGTRATVSRNFALTVTFNPSDIIRADGYASLTLTRRASGDPWMVQRWRDDSQF
ncbi:MAG: hypothetical protein AABY75_02280 [Bacteroidota bacterium]